MLLNIFYDLVHVPGVRGVPQLHKPYVPGSAIYLGWNLIVSISSPLRYVYPRVWKVVCYNSDSTFGPFKIISHFFKALTTVSYSRSPIA
jgi:hypothetical protein